MNILTKHLFITGRVQGVGFRYSMNEEARRLGAYGWVKNNSDGRVEAMIQGDEKTVHRLIEWAKVGPPMSRVEQVEVLEGIGKFDGFRIA